MRVWSRVLTCAAVLSLSPSFIANAAAQSAASQPPMPMNMQMPAESWHFMQDGIVFAEYDHQGGPRGGDQFVAPNWWMGMATRDTSHGRVMLKAMLSLDPATVGTSGYRELFQAGEAVDGRPLIDRQHPHDLFMQLAAVWRVPLTSSTGFTLAGGPVGEPALGPVAFMHRASAMDNPSAPLSHHTFDSTHIAFGIATAALDRGPWTIEGSIFNGREPDQNRWDFDFGRLDSFSARVWYRPNAEWAFQVSSGRLVHPEQLEPGNIIRSTVSASWTKQAHGTIASVTAGFGRNDTDHGARHAFFIEGARHGGRNTLYTRFELLQAETALLQTDTIVEGPAADVKSPVAAFTAGAVRDVMAWGGFEGGIGADLTAYAVPGALQPMYSAHPLSFHVFFRLRPPSPSMGRMWNMWMAQPAGASMAGMR